MNAKLISTFRSSLRQPTKRTTQNRPPAARRRGSRNMHCCLGVAALLGLCMRFPAAAQTIDFGTVVVGESRVGETEKFSYRAFPYGCMDVRATLLHPETRREDNSPPFSFAESPSFRLCSTLGSKTSRRVKVTFRPTTPGSFTRLLRVTTSFGGERWYTLMGRAESLPPLAVVHVDSQYSGGTSDGTSNRPYRTVREGLDRLEACGTLKVRTGHYPVRLVLTNCLRLESYDGPTQLGDTGQASPLPAAGSIEASPEVTLTPAPTSAATLQASSVLRPADGTLLLLFTAAPGQQFQVLSSTNLTAWAVWPGLDAEEGTVVIELPEASREPMRFFMPTSAARSLS